MFVLYSIRNRHPSSAISNGPRHQSRSPLDESVIASSSLQWAIVCPVCHTVNDPDYRFCRHCINDLSQYR
ncbi:DUF7577 domain-containing protein [Halogranum amylolyticum]